MLCVGFFQGYKLVLLVLYIAVLFGGYIVSLKVGWIVVNHCIVLVLALGL